MNWIEGTVGHVCYVAMFFVAGALIGRPMWMWTKKRLPWGK